MQPSRNHRKWRNLARLFALLLCAGTVAAVAQNPVAERIRAQRTTSADQKSAAQAGSQLGQSGVDEAAVIHDGAQDGGPKGAGCTPVKGMSSCMDNEEMMGRGYDQTKVERAGQVDGKMKGLRDYYAEGQAKTTEDDGPTGAAYKTAEDSADASQRGFKEVAETNWDYTKKAVVEGRNGSAQGLNLAQCTTTTTVNPGTNPDAYLKEQHVCEIVNIPGNGSSDPICTRERIPTPNQDTVQGHTEAYLGTPGGQNETFCSRTTNLDPYSVVTPYSKNGELDLNTDVGGLSCRRERTASSSPVTLSRERIANLGVSTEQGGLSCTRSLWPSNGSATVPNSMTTTVSINNEAGGLICTRQRQVTTGAVTGTNTQISSFSAATGSSFQWSDYLDGMVPPGATMTGYSVAIYDPDGVGYAACNEVSVISAPTKANGYEITVRGRALANAVGGSAVCAAGGSGAPIIYTLNFSNPNGQIFSVIDNGNCAQGGSGSCPAAWACTETAPTTINGIPVSAAAVQSLGQLYPGAPGTCVAATLSKTCSGSPSTSNTVSIAHLIPADTTAITNFSVSQVSPQAGVTVTATQIPSAANGWVAVLSVTRTDWSYTPVNPQVRLAWDAQTASTGIGKQDQGNCADPGSTSCPTQWSCTGYAPMTVNGIQVTAAMAQSAAPLFPGAGDTCVTGALNRMCNGNATMGTTVGIGDLIPAGVHTINNFSFTVTNPQAGVSVTLATSPTEVNGWAAVFNVTRTNWTSVPTAPNIRITFDISAQQTSFGLNESGDCGDPGSTTCPTQWRCTTSAPTTIGGISVSVADVAGLAPLFPSAPSACVASELSRVCSGNPSVMTSIGIGDQLPVGTAAIRNFRWTYTNPDPSITITLAESPSQANGWAAAFSVSRAAGNGPVPPRPQVTLTWEVESTAHNALISETGDCTPRTAMALPPARGNPSDAPASTLLAALGEMALGLVVAPANAQACDTASMDDPQCGGGGVAIPPSDPPPPTDPGAACQIRWTCTRAMPQSIGGIPVSQSMLDARGSLYPGDGPPPSCLDASYQRVCADGDAGGVTEISIAQYLQPGTQSISNYSWTITEPGAGVSVTSLQVPALANNWIARFQVIRTDFNVAPASPKVRLTWDMPGKVTWTFPITDTGDCGSGVDDAFCKTEWTCEDQAPQPQRPYKVCGHVTTPWYSGAVASAGVPAEKAFDLASFLTAKTGYITRFKYASQTNVVGCEVAVSPFPPEVGNMRVSQVTTSSGAAACQPQIQFEWDNLCPDEDWVEPEPPRNGGGNGNWGNPNPRPPIHQASLSPVQRFLAGVEKVSNLLLPAAIAGICQTCDAPGGGGYWDGGDIGREPPLFPDDGPPPTCMKATKKQNCTGVWTGTECWINADGEEVCVTVDPDTPPNNDCPALEADPECAKIREECTDGAMADSGWCYVKSLLYECKRKVPGGAADPVITQTTTCVDTNDGATLPPICQDGSCTNDQVQTEEVGMSKAGAKMMMLQTVMNDNHQIGGSPGGGGGGGGGQGPGGPGQQNFAKASSSMGDRILELVGIGSAHAQDMPYSPNDPFKVPDWAIGQDEDPDDGTGGMDGPIAGMNIRFFTGKKRDCMKALGGLFNCCKKTPPQDQSPTLWGYLKENLTQANNAKGRESEADNDPSGYLSMLQGASQEDLMKMFTSNLDSLMGGGQGGDDNTDSSYDKAYQDFMKHEVTVEKPKLGWYCDSDEFELAVGKQTGTCTHLGSFCQTKVLGMCIIKKDRYCCFNSPVTRVLREHLDEVGIADLGTAKNPRCEGLTIEQISKMNLDDVETGEIEGRMAQGKYNIDIEQLMGMSFTDVQTMFDGAKSLVGDDTRQNPDERNQGYVDATDPAGAYSSLMKDQGGYRTDPATTQAQDGTVGLKVLEREVVRGVALRLEVERIGSKGPLAVRVWSEDGTATAGIHYSPVNTTLTWNDGQSGVVSFLLKTTRIDGAIGRASLKLRLEVVSGTAALDGNREATIWLKEQKQ